MDESGLAVADGGRPDQVDWVEPRACGMVAVRDGCFQSFLVRAAELVPVSSEPVAKNAGLVAPIGFAYFVVATLQTEPAKMQDQRARTWSW